MGSFCHDCRAYVVSFEKDRHKCPPFWEAIWGRRRSGLCLPGPGDELRPRGGGLHRRERRRERRRQLLRNREGPTRGLRRRLGDLRRLWRADDLLQRDPEGRRLMKDPREPGESLVDYYTRRRAEQDARAREGDLEDAIGYFLRGLTGETPATVRVVVEVDGIKPDAELVTHTNLRDVEIVARSLGKEGGGASGPPEAPGRRLDEQGPGERDSGRGTNGGPDAMSDNAPRPWTEPWTKLRGGLHRHFLEGRLDEATGYLFLRLLLLIPAEGFPESGTVWTSSRGRRPPTLPRLELKEGPEDPKAPGGRALRPPMAPNREPRDLPDSGPPMGGPFWCHSRRRRRRLGLNELRPAVLLRRRTGCHSRRDSRCHSRRDSGWGYRS